MGTRLWFSGYKDLTLFVQLFIGFVTFFGKFSLPGILIVETCGRDFRAAGAQLRGPGKRLVVHPPADFHQPWHLKAMAAQTPGHFLKDSPVLRFHYFPFFFFSPFSVKLCKQILK